MVDIQNKLFTALAIPLREQFPGILVVTALNPSAAQFPCVQIEEVSNVPVYEDTADRTRYARLTYRLDIYSNSKDGKVQEARKILAAIDDILEPLNMRRTGFSPSNGLFNNTVYLISASYSVTADEDGKLYRY